MTGPSTGPLPTPDCQTLETLETLAAMRSDRQRRELRVDLLASSRAA